MELALRNNSFGWIRQICLAVYTFAAQIFGRKRAETKDDAADRYLREIMDKHGNRLLRMAYSYLHNMDKEIMLRIAEEMID